MVEETNLGVVFESELLELPSWIEQLNRSQQTRGLTPTPTPQVSQEEQREEKRNLVINYSLNL